MSGALRADARLLDRSGGGSEVRLAEVAVQGSSPPVTSTTTAVSAGGSLSEGAAGARDEGEAGALANSGAPRVIMMQLGGVV
ncbi:hypothetical protein PF005_g9103 [Phytophthora fragariae]|uniref:Uncharacterized protein n=1 Tax=Phytophthora fragariae TaxID=53985 RepID=A0A6A3SG10_9STRA|nr:hypothetical protein PF003_g6770 [Phytophthora fragariae]KAE8939457.1 hypothetical protein PF009_g10697 [Phytophthora fragariae]KAE9015973.1 hypothetical protein PF011_g7371 [Phytophthora fragariae]KAE9116225.1 hypothetical protein PF007_g9728 [Phytophthora fragariae]KAE9118130.1 hypothetical protein PF010_g8327 [Phytophthora fragariae]